MNNSLADRMTAERKAWERDCELAREDDKLQLEQESMDTQEREHSADDTKRYCAIISRRIDVLNERATLCPLVVNYELSMERTV